MTRGARGVRLDLALIILAAAFVVLLPRPAIGCSCAMPDLDRLAAESPAAFVGTLVSKVPDPQEGPFRSTANPATYTFEVEQWVKGDLGEMVEVRSPESGASCGLEVPIGWRAGLFLYLESGEITSLLCATVSAESMLAWAAGPTTEEEPGSTDTTVPPLVVEDWAPQPPVPQLSGDDGSTPARVAFLAIVIGAAGTAGMVLSRNRHRDREDDPESV